MDEKLMAQFRSEWTAGVPNADPRFVVGVMARIEQRRFRRELATTAALAVCAAALLADLAPTLELAWEGSFAPYASNLTILLALMGATLAMPYFLPTRSD